MKCWASLLGDCAEGQSGEHPFSQGLFKTDEIRVAGLPFCLTEPKVIPKQRFVRNILCRRHNTALSPVDAAAARLVRLFEQAQEFKRLAPLGKPAWWPVQVDGRLIERWLIKTVINFHYGGALPIGRGAPGPGLPASDIVRAAFGVRDLPGKAGMYFAGVPGAPPVLDNLVELTGILWRDEFVAGALVRLAGHMMALSLVPELLPPAIVEMLPSWRGAKLLHHLRTIEYRQDGVRTGRIRLRWAG